MGAPPPQGAPYPALVFSTHPKSCGRGFSLGWCCQKPLRAAGCTQRRQWQGVGGQRESPPPKSLGSGGGRGR